MIKRLRNRFIRIATLSVAAVMLLLTVILNVANYSSIDRDQQQTLTLIYENQGTIPGIQTPPDSTSTSGEETAPSQKQRTVYSRDALLHPVLRPALPG